MKTKWLKTVVVLMMASLAGQAMAATWTGAGADDLWSNPDNWQDGILPAAGGGATILAEGNDAGNDYIRMNSTAVLDGDIFGPEWGIHLDIDGGSLTTTGFSFAPIGETSVIDVRNGGYLQVHNLLPGWSWWYETPGTTLNVYDTSMVKATDWMWTGGRINLYGGVIDIDGGLNMLYNPLSWVDIHEGSLIIRSRFVDVYEGEVYQFTRDLFAEAQTWANDGYLKAYGGAGDVIIELTAEDDVMITGVVPEPATLALLGLGALVLRKRTR